MGDYRVLFLAILALLTAVITSSGCQPTVDVELLGAAEAGRRDVVIEALDLGANIDAAREPAGETGLMLAVRHGHGRLVELLLHRGANVDHRRHDGATALMLAVSRKRSQIVDCLIDFGADVNLSATRYGHTEITPLHCWVMTNGGTVIGESLIRAGAKVNAKTTSGLTPLDMADEDNNIELATWLRHHSR